VLRLLASGPDRGHYVVKGGCNLRFWLGSVRYSEDIDLDVSVTAPATLRRKMDKLLGGAPLGVALRAAGASIDSVSAPKQTETTQRWKVALRVDGSSAPLPTKIELSRRSTRPGSESVAVEAVDAALCRRHRVAAPIAAHYRALPAADQKVRALAGRAEPQARDVFDLHVLLPRLGAEGLAPARVPAALLETAAERALDLSYADFAGQVVAYLDPDHVETYRSRQAWETIQTSVVVALAVRP
jgi:hypothetical protein